MEVTPFDAGDDRDAAAYADLHEAVRAADRPDRAPLDPDTLRSLLTTLRPGKTAEYHAVRDGDRMLGAALLFLPGLDNTHVVELEGGVHPRHRRRGIGRALFAYAAERAAALGRTSIQVAATAPAPGARAAGGDHSRLFCLAMGMEAAIGDIRSRLELTGDAPTPVPFPAGYAPVQWCDGVPGDPPPELHDGLARLMSLMDTDAPQGDLDREAEVYDPARLLAQVHAGRAAGRTDVHTAARHEASGRLVAWTVLEFERGADGHADQGVTIVEGAHRRRGLGRAVKAANLAYARGLRPGLRTVDTWNAEENTAMLALNRRIGFRDRDMTVHFQRRIG